MYKHFAKKMGDWITFIHFYLEIYSRMSNFAGDYPHITRAGSRDAQGELTIHVCRTNKNILTWVLTLKV